LSRSTGQEIWSVSLPGSGFVTLLVDEDLVLAATRGEVFGLEAATGRILWTNNMPGQGYGVASIATATRASSAALMAQEQNRQQAAGAAAASAASS
jgi:outer membrane protein assembly factor BamB